MSEAVDEASGAGSATIAAAMRIAGITQQILAAGGRESRDVIEHQLRVATQVGRLNNTVDDSARAAEKHKLEMFATQRKIERGDEYLDNERRHKANENFRSQELHNSRMVGQALMAGKTRVEAAVTITEAIKRDFRADRKNEAEVTLATARTNIAWADHNRRGKEGDKEQERKSEEHTKRMGNLSGQDSRAKKKHKLEMKEIRQRMAQRNRSAGLTDDLAQGQRDQRRVHEASAAFAAAATTADHGPRAARDAQAYADRAREDGLDPETASSTARPIVMSQEDLDRLIEETVAATLASVDAHSAHPDGASPEPPSSEGHDIGDAVNAAASPATDTGTARADTVPGPEQPTRSPGAQAGPAAGP